MVSHDAAAGMTATAMAAALCLFEELRPKRGLAANVVTRQADVPEHIVRHRAELFAFAPGATLRQPGGHGELRPAAGGRADLTAVAR